ncbi:glycosyltransferase [Glutamicibacter sp. PS]|uniref:glycosyltransferase family 2 protein n=1 Tax=Glutamicibacter sp. PS TaxID=3075634 RepID=UPI00283B496F|nr:glycosyltransferase [Glutamicibacter sp. PS]MDR4532968.1 glycosyltransferase [Glutamicibacter sp. PS]
MGTLSEPVTQDGPILVSVVIPVYNAMPYLTELLNSLEIQDLDKVRYEVIAVNDGSTDYGNEILDVYAKRNCNFRVIHQENSGWPGKPRNVGIENARGRYVFFCDADDRLGEQALRRMTDYAVAHDVDVLVPKMVGLGGRRVQASLFAKTQLDTSLEFILASLSPQKMIKKSLLETAGIRFREDKVRLEDGMAMVQAYVAAKRISILADYDYYQIRSRADGQNISIGAIEPTGYVRSLSHIAQTVRDHTGDDPTYTARLVSGLFRRKGLRFYQGARFLSYSPENRRAWVTSHKAFLAEFLPAEYEEFFKPEELPTVHAIVAEDLAELEQLAQKQVAASKNPEVVQLAVDNDSVRLEFASPVDGPQPVGVSVICRDTAGVESTTSIESPTAGVYQVDLGRDSLLGSLKRLGDVQVDYAKAKPRRLAFPEAVSPATYAGLRAYRTAYGYLSIDVRKAVG